MIIHNKNTTTSSSSSSNFTTTSNNNSSRNVLNDERTTVPTQKKDPPSVEKKILQQVLPPPRLYATAKRPPLNRPQQPSSNQQVNAMGFAFKQATAIVTTPIAEKEATATITTVASLISKKDIESATESISRKVVVVGVLLIDHGSRNHASNRRLQSLARMYQTKQNKRTKQQQEQVQEGTNNEKNQSSVDVDVVVVRGAHMEIAKPSILDGIKSLVRANVTEIVCHPYFLSPGRHVVKDIPMIVNDIIQQENITVPVTITDPIGSNTDLMLNAIDGIVQQSSMYYKSETL